MTIALSTPSYNHYPGTNTLSLYPVSFPTYESSTLKVVISTSAEWDHISIDGVATVELVLGTDYEIINLARPNTAIQLLDASDVPGGWVGPIPDRQAWLDINGYLDAGFNLYIDFISNALRPSAFNHGNQLIPSLSKDMDRLAMHIKSLDHKLLASYAVINTLIEEIVAGKGSVPSGFAGDYLEYISETEVEAKTGVFAGYSGTLGATVNTTSLTEALTLLFDFQTFDPTMTITFLGIGSGPFEKGVGQSVTNIRAAISQGTAELDTLTINAVTGAGASGIPDGPWNFYAPADFNETGSSNVDTTDGPWTVTDTITVSGIVTDVDSKTGSASKTITFVYPKFYGKAADAADESTIKALTKYVASGKGLAAGAPAGINFVYYAYPAASGNLSSITHSAAPSTNTLSGNWTKTVEDFTMADGATVSYNVYKTNTVSTTTTGTFTFS